MRLPLDQFLKKLAVKHVLSPYETMPWYYYDEASQVTCSAEVRMDPEGVMIEAEVQFMKDPDAPPPSTAEPKKDDKGQIIPPKLQDVLPAGGLAQVLYFVGEPASEDLWTPKDLRVKGKVYTNEMHNWEEKGCDFFIGCVQSIKMEELPDIEDLVERNLQDESASGGGRRGRIGRKSPKVKPGQLLGMGKKP